MQYFNKVKPECQHTARRTASRTQALALRLPLPTCTRQREADRWVYRLRFTKMKPGAGWCGFTEQVWRGERHSSNPGSATLAVLSLGKSLHVSDLQSPLCRARIPDPPYRAVDRITKERRTCETSAYCVTQKQHSGNVSGLYSYLGYV